MSHASHVILSYNKPQLTRACIKALLTQRQVNSSFITLVHNGSTPEVVTELQKEWPALDHLELPQNKGFSGGANQGLQRAFQRSKWVFFHTNDTETLSLPESLPNQEALYAPLIFKRKTQQIDSLGAWMNLKDLRPQHCRSHGEFELIRDSNPPTLSFVYVPGTAFLVHQQLWQAFGPFDESYHTYWEDIDLSYRIFQKQADKLRTIPNWRLRHGIGKTCHKKAFYTQNLFPQNRFRFAQKYQIDFCSH